MSSEEPPRPPHDQDGQGEVGNSRQQANVSTFSSQAENMVPTMYNTANIQKLNGTNFTAWRREVEMVLKLRGLKKALETEDCDERIELQAMLVLLETMDHNHKMQVQTEKTAKSIMEFMVSQYEDSSAINKHRLLSKYFTYKKETSDNLHQHLSKLKEMRATLANFGWTQPDDVFHIIVINSMPGKDDILKTWDLMHPSQRTTDFLVHCLKQKEQYNQSPTSEQVFTQKEDKKIPNFQNLSIAERKRITTCAKCGKRGHWAAECRAKVMSKEKVQVLLQDETSGSEDEERCSDIREVTFKVSVPGGDYGDKWIMDSGASSHMSKHLNWFTDLEMYTTTKACAAGDGRRLSILGKGSMILEPTTGNKRTKLSLRNVLFIPELTTNLISVGTAADKDIDTLFSKPGCIMISEGKALARGKRLNDRLYLMDLKVKLTGVESNLLVNEAESLDDYHRVLGHASIARVKGILSDLNLPIPTETTIKCEHCPAGKGKRVSHPRVENTINEPGTLHLDLAAVNKESIEGAKYYLVCKDHFSEYSFTYYCKTKAEVPTYVAKLLVDFEYVSGKPVKVIHSDNGSEFCNATIETLLLRNNIKHRRSTPYCPQQNGRAEREIQTLTNSARTLIKASGLTDRLWAQAIRCATYIKNRLPTANSKISPLERLTGRKPSIANLVEFGTPVHVIQNNEYLKKLDSRTIEGHVVGFTGRRNTYYIYIPSKEKVIKSCDVILGKHTRKTTACDGNSQYEESRQVLPPTKQVNKPDQAASGHEEQLEWDHEGTHEDVEQYVTTREQPITSTPHRPQGTNFINNRRTVAGEELTEFFRQYVEQDRIEPNEGDPNMSGGALTLDGREAESPPILTPRNESPPPIPPHRDSSLFLSIEADNEPRNYTEALEGPNRKQWSEAIKAELEAHQTNGTWEIVPRPKSGTTLSTRWIFTIKRDSSGNIERFKARLVARGFEQRPGIDFFNTHSPVARIESVRTILAVCAARDWKITQFDISTAFLHGKIEEKIHIEPPEGIAVKQGECLKLTKALYGLKQAPKCWSTMFDNVMRKMKFVPTCSDCCVYSNTDKQIILVIYVDDGLVVGPSMEDCNQVIRDLSKHFNVKQLAGELFLGIQIEKLAGGKGIRLSQERYVKAIVERFGQSDAKSVSTPIVDTNKLTSLNLDSPPTKAPYREAVGCLQYLGSVTRPDILFAVNLLARFNHNATELHWTAVKRLIRYLKGTATIGIVYKQTDIRLTAFSDADYAGDNAERYSTSGGLLTLGSGPIVSISRRQSTIAQSTAEAEFLAANDVVREIVWLTQLLSELRLPYKTPVLCVDNLSAIRQIKDTDTKRRSKHIEIKYHYIKLKYKEGAFEVQAVTSERQVADILTKALSPEAITRLRKLCYLATSNDAETCLFEASVTDGTHQRIECAR